MENKNTKKETSAWMREQAIESGEIEGYKYLILRAPSGNSLNGYILFDKKPVLENDYDGILGYVPVHGGITFCHHYTDCSMYGFDTLHFDSEQYPRFDNNWIREQIKIMLHGILKAKEVETKYLRCVSNKGRAKYAQLVQDIGEPEHRHNLSVSMHLLTGKL